MDIKRHGTDRDARTHVASQQASSLPDLLSRPAADQLAEGYAHTVREIAQQPDTWIETADGVSAVRDVLAESLAAAAVSRGATGSLVLTGSGSSLYVGQSAAAPLQRALGVPVSAVASGDLLTDLDGSIPSDRPGLLVSFARSGDSPESAAAVDEVLAARPRWRHLIITCNGAGRLVTKHTADPRVRAIVLADRTCDRSLVMTSSFTNMFVAACALGCVDDLASYRRRVAALAAAGRDVIARSGTLGALATGFGSGVFLGSGGRLGAAREAALKMLEMTGGRIPVLPETFLGLRHGPMSAVGPDTLVVAFLSSDPVARRYESDLIAELTRKNLGVRLLVGTRVPAEVRGSGDVVFDLPAPGEPYDELEIALDVTIGQTLALFRCLSFGLRPDAPSSANIINRVVGEFTIHRRYSGDEPSGPDA